MEKDSLFKLIKSLTPNERGYFIKFGYKVKDNKKHKLLLKLFDDISKGEVYNEEKLKAGFSPKNSKDFRLFKYELFQRVLDSLTDYNRGNSTDSKVFNLLERSKIFLNKGLHTQSRTYAQKAENISNKEERYDLALLAIAYQKDTYHNNIISPEMLAQLDQLRNQEELAAEKIKNSSLYRALFERMRLVEFTMSSSDYSKEGQKAALDAIICSELLQDKTKAITHESKYLYHVCYSIYYGTIKDHKSRLENSRTLLKLMESLEQVDLENSSKYRNVINQFLNACLAAKDFDEFDDYLGLLEKHAKSLSSPYLKARTFLIIQNQKLNKNFSLLEIEKNLIVIEQLKNDLIIYEQVMPAETFYALYCNIIITYFYCEEYKNTIPYINKIINDFNPKINKGVTSIVQCISLIIHYELGNFDLLNYLIKSTRTETQNKATGFELVHWTANLLEVEINKNEKQKEKETKKLFMQLADLLEDEGEKELMKDFYMDVWLQKRYKKYMVA